MHWRELTKRGFLTIALLVVASPHVAGQQATSADDLAALAEEWVESRTSRRVADVSLEFAESEAAYALSVVDRLDAIDRDALTHQEDLTWAVLDWQAAALADNLETYWYLSPLMPASSPIRGVMSALPLMRIGDVEQGEAYLQYLDELAEAFGEVLVKARGRAARGIVLPDEQIDRILPFWRSFASTESDNPAHLAAARYAELGDDGRELFEGQMLEAIEQRVAPAAQQIVGYMQTTLVERAPPVVGMGQYPGGKRAYRIATRRMTTLEITPEEVHKAGLEGVADINRQMAEVRARLGFTGTKAEFHQQLRNDPLFYVDAPEKFGEALMAYDAKIRPHVLDYFLREPEAPYDVRRVNPAMEATLTYGFYNRPSESDPNGYYNYNGSRLSERSLLSGAGLTYHELVPGHHFQINLARENDELPEFRKSAYFSGYGEGWGEYSSSVVAREMGMYDDPYDLYGRLVFDMFFAVRLVVDTGMNYYGWSRPKAMLYMGEHTMESVTQIDSETIRYSVRSPAQALAYRMGRQTWLQLRQRAERELGEAFDVRRFHDAVLTTGSLPLVVLQDHVDWWIEQEHSR